MAVKTYIECDCCERTLVANGPSDSAVSREMKMHDWVQIGLVEQPGYFDYCDECWPDAKHKLIEKGAEYREL